MSDSGEPEERDARRIARAFELGAPQFGPLSQVSEQFGQTTGLDVSGVVFSSSFDALELTKHADAPAVTWGKTVYLGSAVRRGGRLARRRIAHELAHVALHSDRDVIWRFDPEEEGSDDAATEAPLWNIDEPANVEFATNRAGLHAWPAQTHHVDTETTHAQLLFSLMLKALVPSLYSRQLLDDAIGVARPVVTLRSGADFDETYSSEIEIGSHNLDAGSVLGLIGWIQQREGEGSTPIHEFTALSAEQVTTLKIARSVDFSYMALKRIEQVQQVPYLPQWMSVDLYRDVARLHATATGQLNIALEMASEPSEAFDAVEAFYAELRPMLRLLESLRIDSNVADMVIYGVLFDRDPEVDGPGVVMGPESVNQEVMSRFIRFLATQEGPVQRAIEAVGQDFPPDSSPRRELLGRFERFYTRSILSGDPANEDLTEGLSDRNAPPLPITVHAAPQLSPPFFDIAAGADHRFVANVSFGDRYEALADAFGGFQYHWEKRRVPQNDPALVREVAEASETDGDQATNFDVLAGRMRRQARYYEDDLERTGVISPEEAGVLIRSMEVAFGAPFDGVGSVVTASHAISAVGTVITTFMDVASTPRYEQLVQFDEPGMYVVRVIITPRLDEDSEYRRAPGMAWIPVYARPVEQMARMRVAQQMMQRRAQEMELADIEMRLAADRAARARESSARESHVDRLSDTERDELIQRASMLHAQTHGSVADILRMRRDQLQRRQRELASGSADSIDQTGGEDRTSDEASQLQSHIDDVDEKLREFEEHVGNRRSERLTATFVSDTGQVVQPLIEVVQTSAGSQGYDYELWDFTRDEVGYDSASGSSRSEAIQNVLEEYFESWEGFGRGQLSVFVPTEPNGTQGEIVTISIEADPLQIAMDAVENVTLVLSLVAIAAAPLTGGASLAIMVPVGLIGALPAAYRIAERTGSGTFELTLGTAMDIVDVIGGVVGLAELRVASSGARLASASVEGAQAASRSLSVSARWVQGGLAITGLGADGMGVIFMTVQAVEQLRNLPDDMSEGERRAVIMQVVANSLLTVGMQVGGALAGRAAESMEGSNWRLPRDGEFGPSRRSTADADPDGPRVDVAEPVLRRTQRTAELEASLPTDLRGTSVVEDSSLGAGMRVHWDRGPFGMVTGVEIRVGPDAARSAGGRSGDFAAHVEIAQQMQRFMGISGLIRTLRVRVARMLRLHGDPPPGSRMWEVDFELRKLSSMIESRMEVLAAHDPATTSVDRAQIEAELTQLQRQYRDHRDAFGTLQDDPALGYVAADLSAMDRQQLADIRGSNEPTLTERADRWRGQDEFEFQLRVLEESDPAAARRLRDEVDELISAGTHRWVMRRGPDEVLRPRLERMPRSGDGDMSVPSYIIAGNRLIAVGNEPPTAATRAAIEAGYPPLSDLPNNVADTHHYYDVGDGVFDLRLNPGQEGQSYFVRFNEETGRWETVPREHIDNFYSFEDGFDAPDTPEGYAEQMQPLLDDVRQARADRDDLIAGGLDSSRARGAATRASERVGMQAADQLVRQMDYPDLRGPVYPGPDFLANAGRPGDFDLVYAYSGPDGETRFVVIEAKGGQGEIGTRWTTSDAGGRQRSQQGSPEYFMEIARTMWEQGGLDPELSAALDQLMLAPYSAEGRRARAAEMFDYLLIRQPIRGDSSLGTPSVKRFRI